MTGFVPKLPVPTVLAYCTDIPDNDTVDGPRLNNSTKSWV